MAIINPRHAAKQLIYERVFRSATLGAAILVLLILGGVVLSLVRGAWPVFTTITAIAMLGLLITGAYILKGVRKTLHGPVNPRWIGHRLEISTREVIAIAPLMGLMLVVGIWPAWLVSVINATVTRMIG